MTQHQNGYIWRIGKSWYGRWYRDELVRPEDLTDKERLKSKPSTDGSRVSVTRQHAEKLAAYSDRYRSKKDVQPLLDAKLQDSNAGRARPESTLTVSDYGDTYFLPYAAKELKPSTSYGYRAMWRMYLKPQLADISMRDFRCVDATNTLEAIHRADNLGRSTLRHCKALMSSLFSHAKRTGVLDGPNPAEGAGIPRAARADKPTHAYTPDEVFAMLNALTGVARTAVALMFFCGLRPGEARAVRWEDFDGKTLRIRASMWRQHTTLPKTAESVAPVPVAETLRDILAESRRESGYILSSPLGKAVDLHNLASRVVRPALAKCALCKKPKHAPNEHEFRPIAAEWRGWYAFRRGLATLATSLDSQLAAKSLLRHSNVATTQSFYIKSVPADAVRAMQKVDALFETTGETNPVN